MSSTATLLACAKGRTVVSDAPRVPLPMISRLPVLLLPLLLLTAAPTAAAQLVPPFAQAPSAAGSAWVATEAGFRLSTPSDAVPRPDTPFPLALEQPAPPWRAALIGAGVGAAVGGAAFLLLSDGCLGEGDSMCGLAIPLYVGGGAATGGLIGYLLGRRSP